MALGSEHLGQRRKSSAVVMLMTGQGSLQKPLLATWSPRLLETPDGGGPEGSPMPSTGCPPLRELPPGPGALLQTHDVPAQARACREEGAPSFLQILTPMQGKRFVGEGALHSYPFLVCKASKLAAGCTEGLRGSEPSKLKTTVKRVLYKVTKSARLSEQSGASPRGSTCGEAWPGSTPAVVGARGHQVGRYVHIYRAWEGPGEREDVEKGQWGHGKSCTAATGKKKGTRTTTPNHADKTQPVQHGQAKGPGRRRRTPQAAALMSCVGSPGMPFSVTLLLVARGRQPSPYSLREREGAYKIGVMYGITLHQSLCF